MTEIPQYESVLTGDTQAPVPVPPDHMRFFAAIAENTPPTTARIIYTSLQFPVRLKAQLRENLKQLGITVTGQQEVSPEQLEQVYASAQANASRPADIDVGRHRDSIMALLGAAVSEGASDIHIVRRRRTARVSFRINGQIISRTEWSEDESDSICRFIYEILASEQAVTWNPREPQDAVIDTVLSTGTRVRVRVGTIPASPDGYDMVLRVLPGAGDSMPLQHLGYTADQLRVIRKLVRRPSGLVVMGGGVGSGKSTSLVGMLHEELDVHEQRLRIITVEDPPERVIPNATQVPVVRNSSRHSSGSEFQFAIRGALRCDPDTLMVGEIRDRPAAQLVIKFAQSGHRVYTTVHAGSALSVVSRLAVIGIDPAMFCTPDVLKGIIFQTLVPVLCDVCKVSLSDTAALASAPPHRRECAERMLMVLETRSLSADRVAFRGPGCDSCGQSAITGRTLISEIIVPDDDMLRHLARCDYVAAHHHWLSCGGQPVMEHGLSLAVSGVSAPDDIEWQIGQLDSAAIQTGRRINGRSEPTIQAAAPVRETVAGHV